MLFLRWIVIALTFLALPYFVPGISVRGFGVALLLALLWGFLNVTLKPLLVVLTLPITLLTLGLFTFFINGFLLWFLSGIIKGFEVHGFLAAFLGALVLSFVNALSHWALRKDED